MYLKYVLQTRSPVGIIYQNDDLGRDYYRGPESGRGDKFDKMVVKDLCA